MCQNIVHLQSLCLRVFVRLRPHFKAILFKIVLGVKWLCFKFDSADIMCFISFNTIGALLIEQ